MTEKSEIVLRAGVFYDGTLEPPRRNVDIVVASGRIREVRPASGNADRLSACITPGLVNAHAHLELSGEPDPMTVVQTLPPMERMLRAVENARKSLKAGITTIRDLGASENIAIEIREAVARGGVAGPRIRAAGRLLCMTGGHGWPIGRAVDGPWDARKGVREQRLAGADCIKLIATGGVLTKGAVPGLAQLTLEEMTAACDEAHRHGLRVGAHAIGTLGIKDALRSGVDSIEHGHLLDDEAIALFKERGAYLVPTLCAISGILDNAERGGQPDFVVRKAREINEHAQANITRAFQAGVKIAGGSDAGTPFNYHESYADEVISMHRLLGMTPGQALHAATAAAADLLGVDSGVLAQGRPADLLMFERDIGEEMGTLRSPSAVYKDGRLV